MKKYFPSLILAFLAIYFSKDPKITHSWLIVKFIAVALGAIIGYKGYKLGENVRDWLIPDYIVTDNISSMAKAKAFWAIGPQAIGCLIGSMLGISLVFNILGASASSVYEEKSEEAYANVQPELDKFKQKNASDINLIRARINKQNGTGAKPPFLLTEEEIDKCVEWETIKEMKIPTGDLKLDDKIFSYSAIIGNYLEAHHLILDQNGVWEKRGQN